MSARDGSATSRRAVRYRWYVVAVLMVAYIFSYVDRLIMTLLIEPIRADLGLSDTQFGLLHGLAFALFYATLGLPIAHLSDRHSRPAIIAAGIFLWSIATAACGVARTFVQLFTARVLVGVGEAALSPAAYSILADYFPKDQLGRAVAVYSTGSFVGAGLAYIVGGSLTTLVPELGLDKLPMLAGLRPWQITFVVVGLPGVVVALVCWLTVNDPPRKEGGELDPAHGEPSASIADVVRFCRRHRGAVLSHFVGFTFASLALYQLLAWGPAIFIRRYGVSPATAGYLLGACTLVASIGGVLASGWLTDRLRQRGRIDAPMRAGAIGGAGLVLPIALLPLATSLEASVALFTVGLFFASFPMPPSTAAIQLLAPNRMRSRVSAMFLLCNSLVGLAFGSILIGALNDYVFRSPAAVVLSVAIVVSAAGMGAAGVLAAGMRPFRRGLTPPHVVLSKKS